MAGDPTATFDYLTDGVSGAGAQVVYVVCTWPYGVQCQQVRSAEVDDVQIVADAGPVAGLVITSEDWHRFSDAERNLENVGNEVSLRTVPLTSAALSATYVEVAKAGCSQSMRAGGTSNCHVDSQLALTVWVYRRRGILFPYRYRVRNAVRCGGGAEDKALDAGNSHCREQRERPDDIVVPVDLGVLHRFGDQRLRGEVQHAVKGPVENLADVTQLLV